MPLMIGGVLVLLVTVALLYFLFSAKGAYQDAAVELDQVENRLVRLSSRQVFPSETNVRTLKKQEAIFQEYLDGLFGSMSEGQFKAVNVSRAQFPRVLETVLLRLDKKARDKSVTLPPAFSFGFQRYTEGSLPSEAAVARLGIQLRSIASLVDILYEAGVGELSSVERTVFENDAQVAAPLNERADRRPSRRGRGRGRDTEPEKPVSSEVYTDPDGLFTKEHYILSYRAQDEANWAILDRMAQGTPFIIVTKMEVLNSARPVVAIPQAEEEAEAAPQPVSTTGWNAVAPSGSDGELPLAATILPRELRVVAGQELPNVRLEVDLYRFAQAESAETAGEGGEENP
jgi:hypothetical protein